VPKGGDPVGKIIQGVSLDTEVFKKTKRLAKKKQRPWSNYINMILIDHIEKEERKNPTKKLIRRRRKE
jgi:hypothetical protein